MQLLRDHDLDVLRRVPNGGRPHFHAGYGAAEATVDIEDLTVIAGRLPSRARRLVIESGRLRVKGPCMTIGHGLGNIDP